VYQIRKHKCCTDDHRQVPPSERLWERPCHKQKQDVNVTVVDSNAKSTPMVECADELEAIGFAWLGTESRWWFVIPATRSDLTIGQLTAAMNRDIYRMLCGELTLRR
jgi:hypothetical protein